MAVGRGYAPDAAQPGITPEAPVEPVSPYPFEPATRGGLLHVGDLAADQVVRVAVRFELPLGEIGREIGVELTPSGLMNPIKSVSLVMGLGAELVSEGRSCDYCAMRETCRYKSHYN